MKLLFELSKEHKTLPRSEVGAALEAESICYTVVHSNDDVLVVEIKPDDTIIQRLSQRLAMTFVIDTYLFSCPASIDEIVRTAEKHPLKEEGSIAIRCNNRSSSISSEQLIDRLGDIYTKNRLVNLTTPAIELRVVITEEEAFVGIKKASLDMSHFQKRRGHLRPFLSPVTLHPKIARALVNLSAVKTSETLLDPFCGTGGILLEAGFLGINVIGSDIEKKMIEGCQKNLDYYHLKSYKLFNADIGDIPHYVPSVDAVVTDFPYARATTTKGEELTHLYTRAFETIAQVLKKNRRAVVGLSSEEIRTIGENYLSVVDTYAMKSHRSLTRYFVVYQQL